MLVWQNGVVLWDAERVMTEADWQDDLFVGKALPPGYRIEILAPEDPQPVKARHLSGGQIDGVGDIACPNCQKPLFPVFRLDMRDRRLAALELWKQRFLHLLLCQFCGL